MKREDIGITFENQVLTIRGERKLDQRSSASLSAARALIWRFSRAFTMPSTIDAGAISASYKDGVLTVEAAAAGRGQAEADRSHRISPRSHVPQRGRHSHAAPRCAARGNLYGWQTHHRSNRATSSPFGPLSSPVASCSLTWRLSAPSSCAGARCPASSGPAAARTSSSGSRWKRSARPHRILAAAGSRIGGGAR